MKTFNDEQRLALYRRMDKDTFCGGPVILDDLFQLMLSMVGQEVLVQTVDGRIRNWWPSPEDRHSDIEDDDFHRAILVFGASRQCKEKVGK